MRPIHIDDPNDPRVSPYRDIRERDLAGRQGLFVAEGKVVLNLLFAARRFIPQSALILENRLDGMRETLADAPADMPVYAASAAVMDAIVGFHIHRGVLAIGHRPPDEDIAALLDRLPATSLVVVLVGIANHDNVGAIFRNAAAFGADAVILDETCCDPLYRKAIRVSVGAALKVPFARAPKESLIEALAAQGFEQVALSPGGALDIGQTSSSTRMALYLGTEGEGLPQSLLGRLKAVRIPIATDFDSLNVAAASAIALHHYSNLTRSVG